MMVSKIQGCSGVLTCCPKPKENSNVTFNCGTNCLQDEYIGSLKKENATLTTALRMACRIIAADSAK